MRLKKIFILIILTILLCSTYVFAAELQITIEGEEQAKPNESKVLTIKISSETEIGVVSGKIEANENITNMNVTGKNNWNLTFNKDTGVFNIYKAEGSKTEEIISIEYTTANAEGNGKITLSNLKMTTIEYETKEVSNVVKDITIKNETLDSEPMPTPEPNPTVVILTNIKITKAPTKITYTEGEKFDKTGMVVTAEYSDGTSKEITSYTYTPSGALKATNEKVTISYTEGETTKTVNQNITVINASENNKEGTKDDSITLDKEIPKAGVEKNILLVIGFVLIVTIGTYLGYKNYKNI